LCTPNEATESIKTSYEMHCRNKVVHMCDYRMWLAVCLTDLKSTEVFTQHRKTEEHVEESG